MSYYNSPAYTSYSYIIVGRVCKVLMEGVDGRGSQRAFHGGVVDKEICIELIQ